MANPTGRRSIAYAEAYPQVPYMAPMFAGDDAQEATQISTANKVESLTLSTIVASDCKETTTARQERVDPPQRDLNDPQRNLDEWVNQLRVLGVIP